VIDPDGFGAGCHPEAQRQLQQQLGHPAGHIGEELRQIPDGVNSNSSFTC
jgi:hypothetical protein